MRVLLALSLLFSVSWSPDTGLAQDIAPAKAADADALTVLSLNLARREDVAPVAAEIRAIGGATADVLVLQEVTESPARPGFARELAASLGPDFVTFAGPGLAVLSRVPIADGRVLALKRFNLTFRSRDRTALAVTLETTSGPLRIYNVHLDTRINGGDRIDQIADVIEDIHRGPGPAIVAGDFNTNDHLWLFHTLPLPYLGRQASGLERYMYRHGFLSAFQNGATHDTLRMRLDWLFLKGMRATQRSIHPMEFSDHHALVISAVPATIN